MDSSNLNKLANSVLGDSQLTNVDYILVGVALAVVLCCGLYHGIFSGKSRYDFFVGSRAMRTAPVAVSISMVFVFALAVIQNPADLYYQGIQPFMITIVTVAVLPVGTLLFVKIFHDMSFTNVFQYLRYRFQSKSFQSIVSLAFIVHQTVYTCVILGAVSFVLERYFHIPVTTSAIGIAAFSTALTTTGGLPGMMWAQAFLYVLLVAFLSLVTVTSAMNTGGVLQAFQLAADNKRLELFEVPLNIFTPHNLWNYGIGYGFFMLTQVITYQPVVQRYSSTETRQSAMKSMLLSVPLYFIPHLLCLMIAICLQAAYAGCDPFAIKRMQNRNDLVANFVSKTSLKIPGLNGAFVATIVGCAISVYSTATNSVVACLFNDIVDDERREDDKQPSSITCRLINLVYAGGIAAAMYYALELERFTVEEHVEPLVNSANFIVLNAVLYGPLEGVFIMGLFIPCVNKYGAAIGFLGGLLLTGYVAYRKLFFDLTPINFLDPMKGDCPIETIQLNGSLNLTLRAAAFRSFLPSHPKQFEAASLESNEIVGILNDFSSEISYLLLALVGSLVTLALGVIGSLITGGCCTCLSKKVPAYLLHPILRVSSCCTENIPSTDRYLQGKPVRYSSHLNVDRICNPGAIPTLGQNPPSYKYRELSQSPDLV